MSSVRTDFSAYPQNVGILAMDIFFPKQYIAQADLEAHDGVSAGKYVIGLGQTELAYCSPRQDIYSLALSAVSSFMAKNAALATYATIGRLEVATETIMDHSKSIKTVLMSLFEASGNSDVEGIDCTNACYGGTNALFNSLAWVESSAWDGRLALVVCGDIAEYAKGPARPTGGAGIVVMLVGPNAPLVVERGVRASHFAHAYDFYKPHMHSPFPVVDGALSQTCYLDSLDRCYKGYCAKFAKQNDGKQFQFADASYLAAPAEAEAAAAEAESAAASAKYFVFHAPYNKLVQKSFARLYYTDSLLRAANDSGASKSAANAAIDAVFAPFAGLEAAASLTSRELEQAAVGLSKAGYKAHVAPGTLLPQSLGNMYTASLYAGILSLVSNAAARAALPGQRVMCFSYGSGLAASLFSLTVPDTADAAAGLARIAESANVAQRLAAERTKRTPAEMHETLGVREALHGSDEAYVPDTPVDAETFAEGEYYLTERDAKGKRQYNQFSATAAQ